MVSKTGMIKEAILGEKVYQDWDAFQAGTEAAREWARLYVTYPKVVRAVAVAFRNVMFRLGYDHGPR